MDHKFSVFLAQLHAGLANVLLRVAYLRPYGVHEMV